MEKRMFWLAVWFVLVGALAGCQQAESPSPVLAKEIVFYDWQEDMPQSVLDAFTKEYGIKVKYLVYDSQEEAIANMQAGQSYDIVVMESRYIPQLVKENFLAELDQRNLSNLKNLSANFRELTYDPGNRYSIPFNWGTTGLIVRSDLVKEPVTRWADLWDKRYAGRNALWFGQPREVVGLTLKSLGYSANSDKPEELEAALARLLELQPAVIKIEDPNVQWPEVLADGQVVVAMGYAVDVIAGQKLNPSITYILPKEGALMWNDTFCIPVKSPNKFTAELFLNFLMRAEINAKIVNENLYATPNEAAYSFIKPDIFNNPLIFPKNKEVIDAELILPMSPEGEKHFAEIWEKFIQAGKQP